MENAYLQELDAAMGMLSPGAKKVINRVQQMTGAQFPAPQPEVAPVMPEAQPMRPAQKAPTLADAPTPAGVEGAATSSIPAAAPMRPAAAPVKPMAPMGAPPMIETANMRELNRLQSSTSGINQIKNPWARVPLQIADAVGSGLFPRIAMNVPGTQAHHDLLTEQARAGVGTDIDVAEADAQNRLRQAQAATEQVQPELMRMGADTARINAQTGQRQADVAGRRVTLEEQAQPSALRTAEAEAKLKEAQASTAADRQAAEIRNIIAGATQTELENTGTLPLSEQQKAALESAKRDDIRLDATLAETQRHNRASEGLESQRIAQAAKQKAAKPLPISVIRDMEKATDELNATTRLAETFRPEYVGNPVTGGLEAAAARLGGEQMGLADPGVGQWWQEYQAWVNNVRNRLFGSALTPGERQQFEKSIVNARMAPDQAQTNLTRQRELVQTALARKVEVFRRGGYDPEQLEIYDPGTASPQDAGVPNVGDTFQGSRVTNVRKIK